jgi:hypothetical protein
MNGREGIRVGAVLCLFLLPASVLYPATATAAATGCPNGIGAEEGQAPSLVLELGDATTVWVCGDGNPGAGDFPLYSEFDLVDAGTRQSFFRVGALDEGTFEVINGALHFTAFRRYPIGPFFKWIDVPFQRVVIHRVGNRIVSKCEQLFFRPGLSKGQLQEIRRRYELGRKSKKLSEDMTELPVLAMLDGDSRFDMLKIARDLRLDGAYAENFDSVRRDYMDIRGGTCSYDRVEPTTQP